MWQAFNTIRMALLGVAASCLVLAGAAHAAPPVVEFDIAPSAVCRKLCAADCAKLHASGNVVEVALDLSTRIVGNETDLKQITIEIRSSDRQLSLVGFSPSTTLQSETVDGMIQVEEHRGTGAISLEYALPTAKIQASAKNAGDSKTVEKKLAPKSLLVASGTFDRSHGVYFTLHPSTQESLQKSRQFVCQFEVPAGFRGDYIQMTCTAVAHNKGFVRSLDSETAAGFARYTIGLYLEGDAEAKQAADLLAERQQDLVQALARQAEAVKHEQPAHWWDKTLVNVSHSKHKNASKSPADEVAKVSADIEDAQRALRALSCK